MKKELIPERILGLVTPILVYYGITFGVTAAGVIFLALYGGMDISSGNDMSRILTQHSMLFQLIAAAISLFPLTLMIREDRPRRIFYYEKKKHGIWYLAAALMAAAASVAGNLLINLSGLTETSEGFQEAESYLFSGSVVVQIAGIGFVIPLCEELIYRGLIFQRMRQFMTATFSMVLSALFFAVMHGNIVQGIYAFILGLLLAFVHEKYGSLLAPVLCHITANCISLVLSLTGIVPGRTQALVIGIAGVAAVLLLIVQIDRHVETLRIYPDDHKKSSKDDN